MYPVRAFYPVNVRDIWRKGGRGRRLYDYARASTDREGFSCRSIGLRSAFTRPTRVRKPRVTRAASDPTHWILEDEPLRWSSHDHVFAEERIKTNENGIREIDRKRNISGPHAPYGPFYPLDGNDRFSLLPHPPVSRFAHVNVCTATHAVHNRVQRDRDDSHGERDARFFELSLSATESDAEQVISEKRIRHYRIRSHWEGSKRFGSSRSSSSRFSRRKNTRGDWTTAAIPRRFHDEIHIRAARVLSSHKRRTNPSLSRVAST